jgi:peptidoglycan/xylan/chitin deacetylase (PgdA/CDA1 family)
MRSGLKRVAERLLLASGWGALQRARRRGRTLVLAFHNIVPQGERPVGDLSLHLPQRSFARLLDLLVRTHDVVPLTELWNTAASRRPRVVLTFDDAYRGAVTAGVAELARRGLPGTVFVAPAFIGGKSFWWDVVANPRIGAVEEAVQDELFGRLAGQDGKIRDWAAERAVPCQEVPWHTTAATEAELADAAATPGITLGSHSWSHPNLTRLDAAQLGHELTLPMAWLRERYPSVINWLAYPYGLASPAVEEAAAAAGYEGALRVSGGWIPAPAEPRRMHALPRLNIPAGMSPEGVALRAAGVLA